jgi:hypothetical protein
MSADTAKHHTDPSVQTCRQEVVIEDNTQTKQKEHLFRFGLASTQRHITISAVLLSLLMIERVKHLKPQQENNRQTEEEKWCKSQHNHSRRASRQPQTDGRREGEQTAAALSKNEALLPAPDLISLISSCEHHSLSENTVRPTNLWN